MLDERDPEVRRILARYEELSAANAARAEQLRKDVDTHVETLAEAKKKREEEFERKLAEAEAERARVEAEKKEEEDGEDEKKKERASINEVWGKATSQSSSADGYANFGFEGDDEYYAEEEPVDDAPGVSAPPEPTPAPVAEPSSGPAKSTAPAELYDDDEGYDGSWLRG